MLELLSKNEFTQEELAQLDVYLSQNIELMVSFLKNNKIIEIINQIKDSFIVSKFLDSLLSHLNFEDYYALFINEEDIGYYEKLYDLEKRLDYDYSFLGLRIADYYYNLNNKEKAISLYEEVIKPGFDLSNDNYYETLERYIDLKQGNSVELIKNLIDNSPTTKNFENDLVSTYLLLLTKMPISDKIYVHYINKALPFARKLARKIQRRKKEAFSDSDEERNLCELLCLKFEYFVTKKNYIKAFNIYQNLTQEIGKSDCVRYYHARDKIYKDMLFSMSKKYEEIAFLNDISFTTFELLGKINNLNELINKEITLRKEDGSAYNFIVKKVYNDEVTIVPILPLIKEGGNIYTIIEEHEGRLYLKNNHR